eukprot:1366640-Amorphochlora_amoeboformis.AAC.1
MYYIKISVTLSRPARILEDGNPIQDSGRFDVSAQVFDSRFRRLNQSQTQSTPTLSNPNRQVVVVSHSRLQTSTNDSVEIPVDDIPAASCRGARVVFSSTTNFREDLNITRGSTISGLATVTLFCPGERVPLKVSGVLGGIIIRIDLDLDGQKLIAIDPNLNGTNNSTSNNVDNDFGFEYVCQFYNETILDWDTSGCTAKLDLARSQIVCNCTHLTSFQGVQAPRTVKLESRDVLNAFNWNNIIENPFTRF